MFPTQPLHPSSQGDRCLGVHGPNRSAGRTVLTPLPGRHLGALVGAGGVASDSPADPRPAALRGKGKLLLRSGLGRAQCGRAPCMPGPQSLQAPHRPPEWGQVNVAMARSIPFPDEETHVAGGRLPGREGQTQHPDPERGESPPQGRQGSWPPLAPRRERGRSWGQCASELGLHLPPGVSTQGCKCACPHHDVGPGGPWHPQP